MSLGRTDIPVTLMYHACSCDLCHRDLGRPGVFEPLKPWPKLAASYVGSPIMGDFRPVYRMDADLDEAAVKALAEANGWAFITTASRAERAICPECRERINAGVSSQ